MMGAALVEDAVGFMLSAYDERGRLEDAEHSLEVAALLVDGEATPEVIAAGALHDVVEDTGASLREVRDRFGPVIAEIVGALTENSRISEGAQRKRALREAAVASGAGAREVFLADKLARLRAAERDGAALGPDKLEHYRRSWEMLAATAPRSDYLDELGARLNDRGDAPSARGGTAPRGGQLVRSARSAMATSAALNEQSRAVIAQARQALAHARRGRREPRG